MNTRSEVVKKDTFVITGNATTNGKKTELNIHVESKGQKPQGTPILPAPLSPSAASTQIPPKPGQNNKPTGKGTRAAGTLGQNQINGSTKGPTNQQPSKNLGTTSPGATPTKNPPKPGQNNKPTGKGTSAAGTLGQNQINGSTKGPSNQQPSKSLGTTSPSAMPTQIPTKPGQNTTPTGQVTSASGKPGQKQINALTKATKNQQPSKGPGPTPPIATAAPNPPKPGQNIKPTGQVVTSASGNPGQNQINASTKGTKNQQPSKGPGPTPPIATAAPNPPKPGQNIKPTGQVVTSASGNPGQNQINASTKGTKNQQPSKGPGPTQPNSASTQNPPKPGQNNKPTGPVTTTGGAPGQNQINASSKPPATKAPTSTQKPGQPNQPAIQVTSAAPTANPSKRKGKAFQVIKPTSKNPKSQTPNSTQSGATTSPVSSKVPATVPPPPIVCK